MTRLCCAKCGISKPVTEFWRHARRKSGFMGACKRCATAARSRGATGSGAWLPLGPLRDAHRVAVLQRALWLRQHADGPDALANAEAELFGVTRRTIERWKSGETTRVQVSTAERICDHLGVHPAEIWGQVYVDMFCGESACDV